MDPYGTVHNVTQQQYDDVHTRKTRTLADVVAQNRQLDEETGKPPKAEPAKRDRAKQTTANQFHSKYVGIDKFLAMAPNLNIKNLEARLLYQNLYLAAWKQGGIIANDTGILRSLARMEHVRIDKFEKIFAEIRHLFEESGDSKLFAVPGMIEEHGAALRRRN